MFQNPYKLPPNDPLGSYADFTYLTFVRSFILQGKCYFHNYHHGNDERNEEKNKFFMFPRGWNNLGNNFYRLASFCFVLKCSTNRECRGSLENAWKAKRYILRCIVLLKRYKVSFSVSGFRGGEVVIMTRKEQGWRSGESSRLPPMWPGFNSSPVS